MKYHLITFGYPDIYYDTGKVLAHISKSFFDTTTVYTKSDIDNKFLQDNPILHEKRGAGYWVWKPYFIRKKLLEIEDNDVVFYADCRCSFIADPRPTIEKYFTDSITVFHVPGDFRNYENTKQECFSIMQCYDLKYKNGRQYNAAFQIYKKNNRSLEFINENINYCTIPDCVNDNLDLNLQDSKFVAHRWDQSIFSNLCIKYNITARKSPCQWGEMCSSLYPLDDYNKFIFHHRNFMKLR